MAAPRHQRYGTASGSQLVVSRAKDVCLPLKLLRVQELCESRGDRPGLSVLTSPMVSVDVKQHSTTQFVPNTSIDIRGH